LCLQILKYIILPNFCSSPVEHTASLISTPSVTKFHQTYETRARNKYFLDYPAKWLLLSSWIASVSETDLSCGQRLFSPVFSLL
jgi:hypothetical protein